jgi:hypothetical protein
MNYIKQLEEQNEQLLQRLAEAEKTIIDKQSVIDHRVPRWCSKSGNHTCFYYGWDNSRYIASMQLTSDKETPWHVCVILGDNPKGDDVMHKTKTWEEARDIVEHMFSNVAVQK